MEDGQIELYLKQFPDEEVDIPEIDIGNRDVIEVYRMVQNQLVVNGTLIDFDLRVIVEVCGLLGYSKQRTLLIIEKFRTIRDIVFPTKKSDKK